VLCYSCIVSGKQNTPDIEILDPVDDSATRAALAGDDAAVIDTEGFDGSDDVTDVIDVDAEDVIDVTDVIDVDAADVIEALGAPDANASLLTTPEVLTPSPKAVAKKKASTSSSSSLEPVSALSAYMSQLADHAPISREEEHELAVRWVEDGDAEAARKMVLANLRLVVKIAMEYRRAWTNTLDLIQEGNVGLVEAVQRYDPYQGVKLSSYAVYWIRAYILKYIVDNLRSVRLGTTRAGRKLFFRLNKEKRALEIEGFEVTPKLLAERMDVKEEDVVAMEQQLARPDISLDAPRFDDSDRETFGDSMSGPGISAEAEVGHREIHTLFRKAIDEFSKSLNDRDLQILSERILADEPRTLAEMGVEFDVSRERVRQLEARIVNSLREYMKEELVDFELYTPNSES
jgi:RNA polymerase sigma-32 factor